MPLYKGVCHACADGRINMDAHSFMPGAPDRAAAPASLPPSTHVPEATPRAGTAPTTDGKHAFLPKAPVAPEQTLRQKHSPRHQGSPEEPKQAKAGASDQEPRQAGLRSSLTKLAHRYDTRPRQVRNYLAAPSVQAEAPRQLEQCTACRSARGWEYQRWVRMCQALKVFWLCRFVPGAGAKAEGAAKLDASKHGYLPQAEAKPEVILSLRPPNHALCRCQAARYFHQLCLSGALRLRSLSNFLEL